MLLVLCDGSGIISVYASSQWEKTLQSIIVSQWLGAYTEWSLWFSTTRVMEIFVFLISSTRGRGAEPSESHPHGYRHLVTHVFFGIFWRLWCHHFNGPLLWYWRQCSIAGSFCWSRVAFCKIRHSCGSSLWFVHQVGDVFVWLKPGVLIQFIEASDAIWYHETWSTLFQVLVCCLTESNHYLKQCWNNFQWNL